MIKPHSARSDERGYKSPIGAPDGRRRTLTQAAARRFFLILLAGLGVGLWVPTQCLGGTALADFGPGVVPPSRVVSVSAAPFLAEATAPVPDGDSLVKLMLGLSFLVNFFLLIGKFCGGGEKREITNDPLTVQAKAEYASSKSFERHVAQNDAEHKEVRNLILEEVGGVYERLEKTRDSILGAGARREETLRNDIQKLTQLVGELRGQIAEISKRLK